MKTPEEQKQKQLKNFKKLSEEWRNEKLGAQTPDLYKSILTAAMNIVQLAIAKELDQDLANLKEQVKVAQQGYSDGTKENNLRIQFLVEVLRGRGEDVPDPDDFIRKAANGEVKEDDNAL
jgi:hypothetical protein